MRPSPKGALDGNIEDFRKEIRDGPLNLVT